MIAEPARILGKLTLRRPAGADEVKKFAECRQDVHEAQPGDRASHKWIPENGLESGNHRSKVVTLPEGGPRDQDEQQTCFKEQGDEEETSKQGKEPSVFACRTEPSAGLALKDVEQGRRPERSPVGERVAVSSHGGQVLGCRVAFVTIEAVPWVVEVQAIHQSIAGHLRHDRRGGDGRALSVALHDPTLCHWE